MGPLYKNSILTDICATLVACPYFVASSCCSPVVSAATLCLRCQDAISSWEGIGQGYSLRVFAIFTFLAWYFLSLASVMAASPTREDFVCRKRGLRARRRISHLCGNQECELCSHCTSEKKYLLMPVWITVAASFLRLISSSFSFSCWGKGYI